MLPGSAYDIRIEHDERHPALALLAALDEDRPLAAPALVAHADGAPVAALSLVDDRALADPFHHSAVARAALHERAQALRASERAPARPDRLTARSRRGRRAPAMG